MSDGRHRTVVLDAGGLSTLADSRRRYRLRALLELVASGQARLTTPAVVLAETVTNTRRDAPLNALLTSVDVVNVDQLLAREAGALRYRARRGSAVDAVVAAMAVTQSAAVVVTSDPDDLRALTDGRSTVAVHAV